MRNPSGPTGRAVTAQAHPRARFRRAIEGRWIFHAEVAAREMGSVTLAEALDLVCLYAEAEPAKYERAALRWLSRYVTEARPSLLDAQIVLAALSELRAGSDAAREALFQLTARPPADPRSETHAASAPRS